MKTIAGIILYSLLAVCSNYVASAHGVLDNAKLSVLSSKRRETALLNEPSHFTTLKRGAFDSELVFKFNTGVKCTGVKYDGVDVWTYVDRAGHPRTVTVNSALGTLWVSYDEFDYLTFKHDGSDWVLNKELSVGPHRNYKKQVVVHEDLSHASGLASGPALRVPPVEVHEDPSHVAGLASGPELEGPEKQGPSPGSAPAAGGEDLTHASAAA